MKVSRTVWALWVCLGVLAFLGATAFIALYFLTAGISFDAAQQIVNKLSADQKVEFFNPQVYAQIRWFSLLSGIVFAFALLAWALLRKQTLHWIDVIWTRFKSIAENDRIQIQGVRAEHRRFRFSFLLLIIFWILYALIGRYLQSTYLFIKINMIFDADVPLTVPAISAWGGESGKHPLITLFFSPLGATLARLAGSQEFGAILVSALFGALCIVLVRETLLTIGLRPVTSTLWVLVLGVSTTHLLFASLPETYIFAAAGIALVFFLMVRYPGNTLLHSLAGIYTLGVTVTNIIMAAIAYLISLRNLMGTARDKLARVVAYGAIIIIVASTLNAASIILLRRGALFFLPGVFVSDISYTSWKNPGLLSNRSILLLEDFFLYNFISTPPYLTSLKIHYDLNQPVTITAEEIESFDNGRQSFVTFIPSSLMHMSVTGVLGTFVWMILLLFTVTFLVLNRLYRTPLVQALLLCMLFNFLFHMLFGLDVFLYSAHWTLLVVLLSAVCLAGRLPERAVQGSLAVMFLALLVNNLSFIASLRHIFLL